MSLRFEPLSASVGAEVFGLNVSNLDDPKTGEELRNAFLKYHLLKIKLPDFTAADQVKFAEIFGDITLLLISVGNERIWAMSSWLRLAGISCSCPGLPKNAWRCLKPTQQADI